MTVAPIGTMASAMPTARNTAWRTLRLPLVLVTLLVLVALLAPWLAPHSPTAQPDTLALRSKPPSALYLFGTDMHSRDVLSRVIHGARVSLSVSALSVVVSLVLGTVFGALAAFASGRAETVMLRALDVLLSLPRLLVLLAITAFWGALSIPALALLLGFTGWYDVARLVHGETHALLGRDFVTAARATGVRSIRLFARHFVPHLVPTLAVLASFGVASTISIEAGLSFLGLGVREPTPSWGSIMRDGIGVADSQWWLTIFPGLATVLAVIACNALGEALRNVFAPSQVDA